MNTLIYKTNTIKNKLTKLLLSIVFSILAVTSYAIDDNNYLIGRGIADVTGPAYGSPMWGFGKEGQNTLGIHNRLKSRAFIFADPVTGNRLVYTSVDIGSIEHNVVLEVRDRLQKKFADLYTLDNLILSATHTHAGPAGYWHTRTEFGLSGKFYKKHFERIVSGIVTSIEKAHDDLQPGQILINKGIVENAGANRSMTAYNANPAAERGRYKEPMDREMTLLKFLGENGPLGLVNWFAVHPTSMTFDNRLISGDHKGYAALTWEKAKQVKYQEGDNFIAAFAQSTPGDITPNLNLDNTGPGNTDTESTQIIGQRQLDVALRLYDQASEKLSGPVDIRRAYINLSNYKVSDEFTGAGEQITCPSAYGYSFGGGSTEDGGGHFLLREGMTEQSWWLDIIIEWVTGAEKWTESVKKCQFPKPILFETGTGDIPLQSQIRSISIARLGSLAIVALPAEVTTMAARRIRETAQKNLGPWAKHIVVAGYANGYAGYITTPEEYETQQYEGGHTLHGKWSLPAYQQLITSIAQSLETGSAAPEGPTYDDWRGKSVSTSLVGNTLDELPEGVSYGDVLPMTSNTFRVGETVTADFWSGNPSSAYRTGNNYLHVEQLIEEKWHTLYGDMDWSTIIRWREEDRGLIASVIWNVPGGTKPGTYRFKHYGQYRLTVGEWEEFEALSPEFKIITP